VLQYHFNWKMLSAMAGVTWWNFYFRLYPGSIRSPQVVEFLGHLRRHLPGRLLIVWDGLRRSPEPTGVGLCARAMGTDLVGVPARLRAGAKPGGIPLVSWEQHELPNLCPQNLGALSHHARQALRRMRHRPTLVMAFWEQAELFPL